MDINGWECENMRTICLQTGGKQCLGESPVMTESAFLKDTEPVSEIISDIIRSKGVWQWLPVPSLEGMLGYNVNTKHCSKVESAWSQ